MGGDGVLGEVVQAQGRLDEVGGVFLAARLPHAPALHRHRRAEGGEGHGLDAARAQEIDDDAPEQGGQVQVRPFEDVDAGVVGVAAGVVVQVDGGEGAARAHDLHHLGGHAVLGAFRLVLVAGPDAVEVRLAVEAPQTKAGRLHVAHEQGQGARQGALPKTRQHPLHGLQAHVLVAMQEDGDEQRRGALAGQFDEGGAGEDAIEVAGGRGEEAFGQVVESMEHGVLGWFGGLTGASGVPVRRPPGAHRRHAPGR